MNSYQQKQFQDPHEYAYTYNTYKANYEKKHIKQYRKHGIFYKTSILSNEEFKIIQQELANLSLTLRKETTSSVAHNRIGAVIPDNSEIIKVLSNPNGSFMNVMRELASVEIQKGTGTGTGTELETGTGTELETYGDLSIDDKIDKADFILSPIVPVELRIYEQRGAGMEWHRDDLLYDPEQIEVVFTVENNSDCVTMWEEQHKHKDGETDCNSDIDRNRHGSINDEISMERKQVETEANSAIILRAGPDGARHAVSALKYGKRSILKFVFMRKDAVFLEGATNHVKQFVSNKNDNKSKSTRKGIRKKKR